MLRENVEIVSSLFGNPSTEDDFNVPKQQLFNGKCTRKVQRQLEFYNTTVSRSLSLSLSACWHSRGKLSFVCLACADEAHKQTIGVAGRHDGADRVSDKWQVKSLTVCFYHRLVSAGFPPVSQRWPLCVHVYVCVCIKIGCIKFFLVWLKTCLLMNKVPTIQTWGRKRSALYPGGNTPCRLRGIWGRYMSHNFVEEGALARLLEQLHTDAYDLIPVVFFILSFPKMILIFRGFLSTTNFFTPFSFKHA